MRLERKLVDLLVAESIKPELGSLDGQNSSIWHNHESCGETKEAGGIVVAGLKSSLMSPVYWH
jgi:hypothetical protein